MSIERGFHCFDPDLGLISSQLSIEASFVERYLATRAESSKWKRVRSYEACDLEQQVGAVCRPTLADFQSA